MRILSSKIHNFRTIEELEIRFSSYTIILGLNNAGKSNFIDALRIFYDKDLKFNHERDFPKFTTTDEESWAEIEFQLDDSELEIIRQKYQGFQGILRIRKIFQSKETGKDGKPRSGTLICINGEFSDERFKDDLGEIIYVPALSRLDEQTKLTGPSALRDLISFVLKTSFEESASYSGLKSAFENFNSSLKTEETSDGYSLESIENEISSELRGWGIKFNINIRPVIFEDLMKNLIEQKIHDDTLGVALESNAYGQGMQRQIVYSLLKLVTKFNKTREAKPSNKFESKLTVLLFEEPEAFLHPTQIDKLDIGLKTMSDDGMTQVIITTHNPSFVSKNISDLPSLVRLYRDDGRTKVAQLTSEKLDFILTQNQDATYKWAKNPKLKIRSLSAEMEEQLESIKYALWIDPRRAAAFFAQKVLIVEGPTEVALINYLQDKDRFNSEINDFFVLDAFGKFNIHRFMNLFSELNIKHAVLIDGDDNKYPEVDETIINSKNEFTLNLHFLPTDIETFLGVTKNKLANDKKPQFVLSELHKGNIDDEKIHGLIHLVNSLLENSI